jgi:integrase
MWPAHYRDLYGRAAAAAGCAWSTPHALRHYAASSMIRAGASAAMVAAVLGDSIATVLDTYVHFFPSDADLARRLLAAGLEEPPATAAADTGTN